MMDDLITLLKDVANNPEFFKLYAKLLRQMYLALLDAGFTREEALQLVVAQGTVLKTS